MKTTFLIAGTIGCLLVLQPVAPARAADTEVVERIVAKADYGIITLSQLMEASQPSIQQIRENVPPEEWENRIREVKSGILMQMINEYVCVRFARENEIKVTEEELDATIQAIRERSGMTSEREFRKQLEMEGLTLDELRENLRRQSLVRKVIRSEIQQKVRVTDTEVRRYWKENADQYQKKARVRVAVLMIEAESDGLFSKKAARDRIFDVHERLESGADFGEMVTAFSDGPAVDQGGDIGFLEEGKVLPVIENAAFRIDVGTFSEPLETSFGWVIVKVLEREDAGVKSLSEVRDEIEQILNAQKVRERESEWFEKQRARTYIQIYDY